MGEGTFLNRNRVRPGSFTRPNPGLQQTSSPSQTAVRAKGSKITRPGMDWILIGVAIALTMFGLLMVYSAGPKFAMAIGQNRDFFLVRQGIWAAVSLVAVFVLSRINYHFYQRLTVLMMIFTLVTLFVAVFIGDTTLGANRSLFSGSIRPSELAKLVAVLYVAVWLTAKQDVLNDITLGLIPLIFILGINGGLIMIQPDLSAAITVVALGGIMFFLAGGAWRQIALTLVAALLVGWLVVNIYPTGIRRITEYLAGLQNPMNASYHVQRSLEAIINGGLFGVGIGRGSTKFTGLPVAPTDSIFAVIAEETGLFGVAVIILAYLLLLWRGLAIAKRAPDQLGQLLASGLTIWIVLEALMNMAVMVNLLPQAGNALPFISYGGSSLLVTLSAIGILMNIARASVQKESTKGGNTFGAVVDLRWRDRRRSVPRHGRVPGNGK